MRRIPVMSGNNDDINAAYQRPPRMLSKIDRLEELVNIMATELRLCKDPDVFKNNPDLCKSCVNQPICKKFWENIPG
jgi:hypothetical protein